jgi:chromate transporter
MPTAGLSTIVREWGRIGLTGFGGPPVHVALLRELCVHRRRWLSAQQFEDANAATGLLPGPASTQLAIFTAQVVGGRRGALVGGACFVVPAVVAVLLLSVLFLQSSPPTWALGTGAGAGAAVAAVALKAGWDILRPGLDRAQGSYRHRYVAYALIAATATITVGPYVVLALLGLGAAELAWRHGTGNASPVVAIPVVATATGGLGALAWTALKVGALSYGGGFVIIPLMQADAVSVNHWMTDGEFLNAVALGQITPGPVVATVVAVGYAAHGVTGGLLAGAIAFAPSFLFVLVGGQRFEALRNNTRVAAFLDGAGPAAAGAIVGVSVPLARALQEPWQAIVLAGAVALLFAARTAVVPTLLIAGTVGVSVALAGGPLP